MGYPIAIMDIEDDDDQKFMELLYVNYHRLMYSQIHKITKNTWMTEDVLHTTIVRLMGKLKDMKTMERNRLVNYVIAASKNTAINAVTKRTADFSFDEFIDSPTDRDTLLDRLEQMETEEDLNRLAEVWPRLDERSQYLLRERYMLDRPIPEMAEELGIQPASVRMALTRARRAARELMLEEPETEK